MNPTRMFIGIVAVAIAILSMYMFQQQHNLGKTPEMALRTCVEAIKDGDMRTFSQYTIDGDTFWKEWKKASREEKDMVQAMLPFMIGDIYYFNYYVTEEEIVDDKATLWVEVKYESTESEPVKYYMRKEGSTWKFEDTENLY